MKLMMRRNRMHRMGQSRIDPDKIIQNKRKRNDGKEEDKDAEIKAEAERKTGREPKIRADKDPEIRPGKNPEIRTGKAPEVRADKDPKAGSGRELKISPEKEDRDRRMSDKKRPDKKQYKEKYAYEKKDVRNPKEREFIKKDFTKKDFIKKDFKERDFKERDSKERDSKERDRKESMHSSVMPEAERKYSENTYPQGQTSEKQTPEKESDAALPRIEGRNAVLEAFRAGKTIDKLYVLDGCKDGPVQTILREAKKHDTIINFVDKERLNQMSETKKHQGVIAAASACEYASVEDILKRAEEKGEDPFLILLDNIEDPHNLGAIIRTANLAGAHGIIIPKRRAAGLTGTAAKASAGAVHYTPVARVANLTQTIRELKERGIWFVCADMDGELMYRQNLTGPVGLVIGSEGEGVSRLVKENCDFTASIPMKGEIGSLNASAAAAVLAYEIVRQRASF